MWIVCPSSLEPFRNIFLESPFVHNIPDKQTNIRLSLLAANLFPLFLLHGETSSHFHLISWLTNYQEDVLNSWPISYRVLMCLSKLSWLVSILVTFEHSMQHIPNFASYDSSRKILSKSIDRFHGWSETKVFSLQQQRLRFICYTTNITNWIYQCQFFL